jgi:hypothetical protein
MLNVFIRANKKFISSYSHSFIPFGTLVLGAILSLLLPHREQLDPLLGISSESLS